MANISESPRLLQHVNSGSHICKNRNERQDYSRMIIAQMMSHFQNLRWWRAAGELAGDSGMKNTFYISHPRFCDADNHAPPVAPACGANFRAASRRRRAVRASTQSRKQRGGRQRHQTEHQMAHHLGRTPHAHPAARESAKSGFRRSLPELRHQKNFSLPSARIAASNEAFPWRTRQNGDIPGRFRRSLPKPGWAENNSFQP